MQRRVDTLPGRSDGIRYVGLRPRHVDDIASSEPALLKQQLRQALANQTFQKNVPGGKVEVRIVDIDIFPSKESLALGLKIDAKTPASWFNTSGWVYLSGKPTVVKDGKAVRVESIHFASQKSKP